MTNDMERRFLCDSCGGEFWSTGTHAKYCSVCRIRVRNEENARRRKEMYASTLTSPYCGGRRRRRRVKPVEAFMRECIEYNRTHGTDLNYGTYDRLLRCERGELTVEVKL